MSCEACDGRGRRRMAVCEFAERRGRAVLAVLEVFERICLVCLGDGRARELGTAG